MSTLSSFSRLTLLRDAARSCFDNYAAKHTDLDDPELIRRAALHNLIGELCWRCLEGRWPMSNGFDESSENGQR